MCHLTLICHLTQHDVFRKRSPHERIILNARSVADFVCFNTAVHDKTDLTHQKVDWCLSSQLPRQLLESQPLGAVPPWYIYISQQRKQLPVNMKTNMLDILTYKRLHLNFDRYKKQINKTICLQYLTIKQQLDCKICFYQIYYFIILNGKKQLWTAMC